MTGGGAWLVDERQLAFELYLNRRDVGSAGTSSLGKRIAHAAATAVSALGVDARWRPGDDIEIDGRAAGAIGCAADGDALLFQGVLRLDVDIERFVRAMRSRCARLAGARGARPLRRT